MHTDDNLTPSIATQLLCTMGTTWQVVPEAFMSAPDRYQRVCVFTTAMASIPVGPLIEFFKQYPQVALQITRTGGMPEIKNTADQTQFEEGLYRWFLCQLSFGPADVCLAGGYKTMSASMQQAARLFGASRVFHVLADSNIRDQSAIMNAAAAGSIHFIELGSEPGWPQLSRMNSALFPLHTTAQPDGTLHTCPSDPRLRSEVRAVLHAAQQPDPLSDALPFPAIATWPRPNRQWLQHALDASSDRDWVHALPKIELHCHLGGFASHGDLLTQVRKAAETDFGSPVDWSPAPPLPVNWPIPQFPIDLQDYMHLGDATGRTLLRHPTALRKHCELLYQHLANQHVAYAEVRCSPNNYTSNNRSAWTVLEDIRNTFSACYSSASKQIPNPPQIHLILIATRKDSGDRSDISRHLALAITAAQHWTSGIRVVGVDLAGFESKTTRAALYETDFTPVHRVGLAVTVHAGENDDAEGIWQAVFRLSARRIGHALRLREAPDLLRTIAERQIGIELCPFANLQIQGFAPMPNHPPYPLRQYLDAGVLASVNTDNIGISAASLSDNLLLLSQLVPGIRRADILALQHNALQTAFLSPCERNLLRSRFHQFLAHYVPPRQ